MSTFTENGAVSYATTGDPTLDLFFKTCRSTPPSVLTSLLEASWKCNPLSTLKIIFHIRDCRGGKGERRLFTESLQWLLTSDTGTQVVLDNLENIPYYGRYKDLLSLVGTTVQNDVLRLWARTLKNDLELYNKGENVSLAAKYAPSERSGIDKKYHIVGTLASMLGVNKATYRTRYLVPLRKKIDIVETKMTQDIRDWEKINFSKVPSLALLRYKKAFERHEPERFRMWLNAVKEGREEMNVGRLMPYQMVAQYIPQGNRDETTETQWKTYVSKLKKTFPSRGILSVIDVSGSMYTTDKIQPIHVAISLGLLTAELTRGPFSNRFFTFSTDTKLEQIVGDSLYDKVKNIAASHWAMSTNILNVFTTLLQSAQMLSVSPENMPQTILILSDMQFDIACPDAGRTNWEQIHDMFSKSGYTAPHLVFWNLRGNTPDFPATKDTKNVTLVSGFSADILSMVVQGHDLTPLEFLKRTVLENPRYDRINYHPHSKCWIS